MLNFSFFYTYIKSHLKEVINYFFLSDSVKICDEDESVNNLSFRYCNITCHAESATMCLTGGRKTAIK